MADVEQQEQQPQEEQQQNVAGEEAKDAAKETKKLIGKFQMCLFMSIFIND